MKSIFLAAIILLVSVSCFAWSGYDADTGASVEIEQGNLVRSGSDIEVYNYDTGEYHDVEVDSINRYGGSVEVEVYDYSTGEYSILEMDGD